ncbi:MAG: glycine cleavage system protein GcvH [Candidatus Omnitrophota bacterium]
MLVPDDLLYTKEHEWVRVKDNTAVIGITDHAQGALGDITFADLPRCGSVVEQFKRYATVESVKAASDVFAPVSGKIVKINAELAAHPELINKSPYDGGHFAEVEMSDPKELSGLMKPAEYKKHIEGLS